jgi:Acyl-CoA carboxylase epsilon subunit
MVTRPADHDQPPSQPLLRVVRGNATPEEIAALVAVLLARPADATAPGPDRSVPGFWSDRAGQIRRPLYPAPGTWRRSGLPG